MCHIDAIKSGTEDDTIFRETSYKVAVKTLWKWKTLISSL